MPRSPRPKKPTIRKRSSPPWPVIARYPITGKLCSVGSCFTIQSTRKWGRSHFLSSWWMVTIWIRFHALAKSICGRKSFSVCSKREREKERRGEFLFRYWTEYILGDDREIWRGADDDWGRGIPRSGTVIVLLIIIEGEKTDRLDVSFLILTVWGLGQFERYDTYAFLFVSSLAKLFSWSWWIIVISFLFDSDYLRSWGPWCGLIWAYISVFIVRRIKYEKIQD